MTSSPARPASRTSPSLPSCEGTFPEGFVFGGATAAYQCEGATATHGKGPVMWDAFLAEQGRFSADPASDFYHRYPEDLALCERFGLRGIRVSIAWSRVLPEGTGAANPEGVAFYHDLFAECRRRNVEPFVTLHHFDTPAALYEAGDFLDRATVDAFVDYAAFCFDEFPEVRYWITFNEIFAVASNLHLEGNWPGGGVGRFGRCLQCEHNMMVAHARAVNLFRRRGFPGQIGIVHALDSKYPADPASPMDVEAARADDVLQNQFLLDATFRGRYGADTLEVAERLCALAGEALDIREGDLEELEAAAQALDFLGVNYYQSKFLRAWDGPNELRFNGTGAKGSGRFALAGIGERVVPEGVATTDWDWLIYPEGLHDLLLRIGRQWPNYGAVYVTECGLGLKEEAEGGIVLDEARIDFLRDHLAATLRALEEGVDVRGFFVWSLQDMFSWNNGYDKRYGLFYVDFETQERLPKASAYWFARLARTHRLGA